MGQEPNSGGAGRPSILGDMVRGALLGDFARELGLPGAAVQVALNFVPVVGSICAFRDAAANWRTRDRTGVLLNLLAVVPVIGAVAKGAEVWRHVQRLRRGFEVSYRVRRPQGAGGTGG
ncbi:MAG: hypothetical protein AVDCRST_MAG18-2809 [uncultured Thermomicrobiales bacterium]|uniref:Uncharacterized protein n=1 Tax=uncultured Thermomicrobiales bacterium TaxID=1645740 RepID=A0A6J4VIJ0_9BACT|nr:MAG: hypothetical protein AVDCRST_MAG18-2809 [uncultured Thermomicrobiales bacterium]